MLRSSIVLHAFGQVKVAAKSVPDHLTSTAAAELAPSGLTGLTGLPAFELDLFLRRAREAGVSAGEYLSFAPSFLLTFYGLLATYVAIIIQTV